MNKICDRTIEIARAACPADFGDRRCWHISVLYDKNRILAIAENKQKTSPRNRFNLKTFDVSLKSICSELSLFLVAKSKFEKLDWKRLSMVNCRIDKNGNIRNSRPCGSCANLIKYLGLINIYYTNNNGDFEKY